MLQAYILIQTDVGRATDVARAIAGIDGVVTVAAVTGPYDVIALARAADVDELGQIVIAKIQAAEGITRTLTCPIVRSRSGAAPWADGQESGRLHRDDPIGGLGDDSGLPHW